jgi:hypothetical protein
MRSEVAYSSNSVPGANCCSECSRPRTNDAHSAGELPNRYSTSQP